MSECSRLQALVNAEVTKTIGSGPHERTPTPSAVSRQTLFSQAGTCIFSVRSEGIEPPTF